MWNAWHPMKDLPNGQQLGLRWIQLACCCCCLASPDTKWMVRVKRVITLGLIYMIGWDCGKNAIKAANWMQKWSVYMRVASLPYLVMLVYSFLLDWFVHARWWCDGSKWIFQIVVRVWLSYLFQYVVFILE